MPYTYDCKEKGCNTEHYAFGYCRKHYAQIKRNGYVGKKKSLKINDICVICGNNFKRYPNQIKQTCNTVCAKINMTNVMGKSNNCNWRGGVADYPNHYFFKKQRLIVLKSANYSCTKCGGKEKLVVHHKDFTKNYNELNNLLVLCFSCHKLEHIANK
jgi:hypothetical protein